MPALPLALVRLSDPLKRPAGMADQLAPIIGLTRAEAEVAAGLSAGLSAEDIAVARGVGLATIRSHPKPLMVKTGTRRQSEPVRLLLTLPRLAQP